LCDVYTMNKYKIVKTVVIFLAGVFAVSEATTCTWLAVGYLDKA